MQTLTHCLKGVPDTLATFPFTQGIANLGVLQKGSTIVAKLSKAASCIAAPQQPGCALTHDKEKGGDYLHLGLSMQLA